MGLEEGAAAASVPLTQIIIMRGEKMNIQEGPAPD